MVSRSLGIAAILLAPPLLAATNPYESDIRAFGRVRMLTRPVAAISAAEDYVMALQDDGTVVAWGFVKEGQTRIPDDLGQVIGIAAGDHHALALLEDGTVRGWGVSTYGRTKLDPAGSKFVAIAAGSYHSLGLRADGTVAASGMDDSGQVTVPVGLKNVVAVSAGERHSMALLKDGTVKVWGGGNSRLKEGIAGLTGVRSIYASSGMCHAITTDDVLVEWSRTGAVTQTDHVSIFARSYAGSVWKTTDDTLRGYNIYHLTKSDLMGVKDLDVGNHHFVALKNDGTVMVWGDSSRAQAPVPAGRKGIASLRATPSYLIAIGNDGSLSAWPTDSSGPLRIPSDLGPVASIAGSRQNWIALRQDRNARFWTAPAYSPYFYGITSTSYPGMGACRAVAAGTGHDVAILEDGTPFAWGKGSAATVDLSTLTNSAIRIDARDSSTLLLDTTGKLHLWKGTAEIPLVAPLANEISLGPNHTLAALKNGTVWAGGEACPARACEIPSEVVSARSVAAGTTHSVALLDNGTAITWGDSTAGRIPVGLRGIKQVVAGVGYTAVLLGEPTTQSRSRSLRTNLEPGMYHATMRNPQGAIAWTGDAVWTGARWRVPFDRPGLWLLQPSNRLGTSQELIFSP